MDNSTKSTKMRARRIAAVMCAKITGAASVVTGASVVTVLAIKSSIAASITLMATVPTYAWFGVVTLALL